MHVGTFSGVKSPGMVISSALGGTSKGNSSLTNDKIKDVLPTFLQKSQRKKLIEAHFHSFSLTQFQKTFLPVSNEQNTNFFSTSNAHDLFGSHYKLAKKNNLLGFTEKNHGSLVQIFGLEKKSKIKKYCFLLSHQICLWFNIFGQSPSNCTRWLSFRLKEYQLFTQ